MIEVMDNSRSHFDEISVGSDGGDIFLLYYSLLRAPRFISDNCELY